MHSALVQSCCTRCTVKITAPVEDRHRASWPKFGEINRPKSVCSQESHKATSGSFRWFQFSPICWFADPIPICSGEHAIISWRNRHHLTEMSYNRSSSFFLYPGKHIFACFNTFSRVSFLKPPPHSAADCRIERQAETAMRCSDHRLSRGGNLKRTTTEHTFSRRIEHGII